MDASASSLAAASGRLRTQEADDALLRRWQTRSTVWAASCDDASVPLLLDAFDACLAHVDAAARLLVLDHGGEAVVAEAQRRGVGAHVEYVRDGDGARKAALLAADALVACGGTVGTVLDALAVGTPVTGIDAGAAAHVAGVAALLWRMDDSAAGSIACTIERLRADASLRSLLRARGHARVSSLAASSRSSA